MANVTLHIKNWLNKATPDYYTMFIKAWIPLNAWYVNEFGTTEDRVAIKNLKEKSNKIRSRIQALLLNSDAESQSVRSHLAKLHFQLESRRIENKGKIISFNSIPQDGGKIDPVTDTDRKGNVYKAIVGEGFYRVLIVAKGGKSLMDKKFSEHKLDSLLTETQYIALKDNKMQEKIRLCFQGIDPNGTISLVSRSRIKQEKILLDDDLKIEFVNDTELIAKSLIQVIYQLRCILFHGEIDPSETNQEIYEHAFYVLKSIIKELN